MFKSAASTLLRTSVAPAFRRTQAFSARRCFSDEVARLDIFNPTEEHKALRTMVRQFAQNEVEPQANEYNKAEKMNMDLFRQAGELGLLGITVEPEFGGSGMDTTAAVIVHEELSASDPGFCLAYLAHSMLLVNNLNQNGNDKLRAKYLPDLCSGAKIGGMGMSEPDAGTDVLALKTTAKKSEDGSYYTLNGNKMWITNGANSEGTETGDVFLVYARTGEKKTDLTLFLIEKGMPGFQLGQKIMDKCGMRASMTAELVFDSVKVPAENIVGEEHKAVACMMRNLQIERVVLAAMSCGIAKRSIEVMNKYAQERTSFGKPLNNFGQIQRLIAESYASFMAGRAYTYNTALNAIGELWRPCRLRRCEVVLWQNG